MSINGYQLNPNQKFVKQLSRRIEQNDGYCPCKLQKIEDNKCPCLEFRTTGQCHCGLWIKKEN